MSVNIVAGDTKSARTRRRWRALLSIVCGAGVIFIARAWWTHFRDSTAMAEIESEIVAGQHAIACRNIEKLLSWKADANGAIHYLLGSCELARGRGQAADAAWLRITAGSEFSERAIEGRMHLLYESGQVAAAEELVRNAALDPRNDRTALLVLLISILGELGRIEEAQLIIEERWEQLDARGEGALEPAITLVLQSNDLHFSPAPVETVRAKLERAASRAPDDDRVWLGRANLAIRIGAYDEAQKWLDAGQARRPDDTPLWRARLEFGMATDRTDVVEQAMTHLPALESKPAQLHRVKAWLARRHGDVTGERRELAMLIAADPADTKALGRLAELAKGDGQAAQAGELLRQKAEVEQMLARYRKLHERRQPIRDAKELARLSEKIGRRFEARAYLTIALEDDPDREDLRQHLRELIAKPAASGERERRS
jgi:enediyne biosynthesis protein E4